MSIDNSEQEVDPEVDPVSEELKRVKELEKAVLRSLEEKTKLEALERTAREHLEAASTPPRLLGPTERRLLLTGALLALAMVPLLQYFWGILLATFTLILSVVAGLTSSRERATAVFNLLVSAAGAWIFEVSAIIEYHRFNNPSFLFWMDELLGLLFLIATYFSTKTYRKKMLES